MDERLPHILNPPISGFSPMIHHRHEGTFTSGESSITLTEAETYPEQEPDLNGSRKRPASRIKSTYPRKRAIQACQKCRARRTKCDNERPSCSACLDLGAECNYSPGDPSSFDAASLAILEKLTRIENLLRIDEPAAHRQLFVPAEDTDEGPSPGSHVKSLNSPTLERTRDPIPCHMNVENVLSWPAFENENPILDLKALLNRQNPDLTSKSMIGDVDQTAEEEQLVQRFLDNVFIFNPVLEEAKIQKYIRDARFNGIGWDAQSCLLLLIYAIGALEAAIDPSTPFVNAAESRQTPSFRQAESYFSAAQRRLGLLLCRSGVTEAQCFFLAGVYLMTCIKPLEAWKMFVQALACCQSFYTPASSSSNTDSYSDRRLKETIYWTCFKSELELRLELNVSENSVWDLTYPSFFPSPPDELKSQREIVWYYYLAEISLRRLGNRILNHIYTYKSSQGGDVATMVTSIHGFEQQAQDWLKSLPRALGLDERSPGALIPDESDLHTTLKFILSGHLLDCYEMMYWPFVAEALSGNRPTGNSQTADIGQTNTVNTGFVHKALSVCTKRIAKNEPGFFYRHHGTWLMLRSCTRSALVLLAADRSEFVKPLLPDNWMSSVGKVVDMLRFWRSESSDVEDRLNLIERMWRRSSTVVTQD